MSLQRNVQQQNEGAFERMLMTAQNFRVQGVPAGVQSFLAQHGIELSTSAIVWGQAERYMLGFEFGLGGLVVTGDHRFFEFELELDSSLKNVIFVHKFSDVTEQQNTSNHNKGIGKGVGAIAIQVVDILNKT